MSAEEVSSVGSIYAHAKSLAERGFLPFPLIYGSKAPATRNGFKDATTDPERTEQRFNGTTVNLAVATGPQPNGTNLVVIDLDLPKNNGKGGMTGDGRETMDTWLKLHGKPYNPPTHKTPRGGLHLLFDGGDMPVRNSSNRLGPGIDVRGAGGYIGAPPSPLYNPITGELIGHYSVGLGGGLWTPDPLPPLWPWLREKLEAIISAEVLAERAERVPQLDRDHPADWMRIHFDWPKELYEDGMILVQVLGNGDEHWRHPNSTNHHSLTWHPESYCATVWSENCPAWMQQGSWPDRGGFQTINGFTYYAGKYHGGDQAAAMSHIRRELMPRQLPPSPETEVHPSPEAADEPDGSEDWADTSWFTPVDLTGILDGTEQLAPPSILLRADGMGMFYPGTINGIHGESGLGKGWVAVTTAAEVIRSGQAVVYVDLEDTPTSITTRLQNVGVTKDQVRDYLTYIRPDNRTSPVAIGRLVQLCRERHVALVVIDSLGEAFGLDSINEDKDNEVGPWLRQVPRTLADTGACVLIVDHVTKSVDNPLYPKGSARKRAAVGGAAYLVEALSPLTKGKGGKLRLTCAKDRYGFHARGKVSAEIVFTPSGEHDMLVKLWSLNQEDDGRSDQDHLDEKVAACAVEMLRVAKRRRSAFTKTNMVDSTAGARAEIKRAAFDLLVERGHFIEVEKGKFKVVA